MKQQRYTLEFRAEAVKLVTEQGLPQEGGASWCRKTRMMNWRQNPGADTGGEGRGGGIDLWASGYVRVYSEIPCEERDAFDSVRFRGNTKWTSPTPFMVK